MKINLVISLLSVVALSFQSNPETPVLSEDSPHNLNENSIAIKLNNSTFGSLTQDYSNSNPGAILGGAIGKSDLQNLINRMSSGQVFVELRFCTVNDKVTLCLKGRNGFLSSDAHMRSGASEDAYCPNQCGLNTNLNSVSMEITKSDYNTLTGAYTGETKGGKIEKSALQAIINSLPTSATSIPFRFCTDNSTGSAKVSIIFVGGTEGQQGGEQLFYRNGGTDAAFCPTICN